MLKKYEEEIIKLLDQLQVIGGLTVILLGVVPRAGMTAAGTAAYRALSQRYSAIAKNDSNAWYLHVEAVLRTKTQPAGTQEGMDTNSEQPPLPTSIWAADIVHLSPASYRVLQLAIIKLSAQSVQPSSEVYNNNNTNNSNNIVI